MVKQEFRKGIALFTVFCLLFTCVGIAAFTDSGYAAEEDYVCEEEAYVVDDTQEPGYYTTTPEAIDVVYDTKWYDVSNFAKLEKYAYYTGGENNNEFKITLNVYGNSFNPPVCKTVNILVLDYSSSMNYSMSSNSNASGGTPSRMDRLQTAAKAYIDQLTEDDFLAIVTYSSKAAIKSNFRQMTTAGITSAKAALNDGLSSLASATNVQGGLIAAYQLTKNPMTYVLGGDASALQAALDDSNTIYNLVFMSDGGANTYYTTGGAVLPVEDYENLILRSQTTTNATNATGDDTSAAIATGAALELQKLTIGAADKKLNCYAIAFTEVPNDIMENTLKDIASSSSNYFSATDWTADAIFKLIRASQTENTIQDGTITDVIPVGFGIKADGITAYKGVKGDNDKYDFNEIIDANIQTDGPDADGITTVTWEDIGYANEDICLRLEIEVVAAPTCMPEDEAQYYQDIIPFGDEFQWKGAGHWVRYTNTEAALDFTNVIGKANGTTYTADFARPAVHVPVVKRVPLMSVEKTIVIPADYSEESVVEVGDQIVYAVTAKNESDVELTDVAFSDVMEGQDGFYGPFESIVDAQNYTGSENTIIDKDGYTLSTTGANQTKTVYYVYTVSKDDGDAIDNTATVTAKGNGEDLEEDDDATIDVVKPDLEITKAVLIGDEWLYEGIGTIESGTSAIFKVTIKNNGSANAKDISLEDKFDSKDLEFKYTTANINDGKFDLSIGETVAFYYSVGPLEGKTSADIEEWLQEDVEACEANITAAEEAIEGLIEELAVRDDMDVDASATVDEAIAAIEEVIASVENDIEELKEAIKELDSEDESYEDDLLNLEGQIALLEEEINGDGEETSGLMGLIKELNDAKATLERAEEALGDAQEILNAFLEYGEFDEELGYNWHTNEATYEYSIGKGSDDSDVKVNPVRDLEMTKKVMSKEDYDDGSTDWLDVIMLESGGEVAYQVLITNNGDESVEVTFEDSMVTWDDNPITIDAGETKELIYFASIHPDKSKTEFPNVATITFGGGEEEDPEKLEDNALVIIPNDEYVSLKVSKKVLTPTGSWVDRFTTRAEEGDSVEFFYKVEVTNYGTTTAAFSLEDSVFSGTMYQDFDETERELSNPISSTENIEIAPRDTLYFYYSLTLSEDTVNTATITYKDGDKDKEDEDDAQVIILPPRTPSVELSIQKKVKDDNADPVEWVDSAEFTAISKSVTFWIQVVATPSEMEEDEFTITGNIYDWLDETIEITEFNGDSAGSFTLNQDNLYEDFYYTVTLGAGIHRNVATIDEESLDKDGDFELIIEDPDDEADVTINSNGSVTVGIQKQVQNASGNWVDSATFTGGGRNVDFRIIVTATPNAAMGDEDFAVTGTISDTFDGKVVEGFDGSFTLTKAVPSKTFTYTAENLAVGTYKNVATIDEAVGDGDYGVTTSPKEDDADVTINSTPGGGNPGTKPDPETKDPDDNGGGDNGGGDNGDGDNGDDGDEPEDPVIPTTPTPRNPGSSLRGLPDGSFLEIGPDGVPLGTWTQDPDGTWIFDEAVPLAGLDPQTGENTPVALLLILALCSLVTIGALTRKRADNRR